MDIKKWLIEIFDDKEIIILNDNKYIINPLTDHKPSTTPKMLETVIEWILKIWNFSKITKLIWEEERWGFIVPLISYKSKIPFTLAKWNPIWIKWEIYLDFRNMYFWWKIYLNWIDRWDKVIIIEDMIDTWWTIISLIKLLESKNIEIIDIISISVKKEALWINNILKKTWYNVKYLCEFSVKWNRSKITKFNSNL